MSVGILCRAAGTNPLIHLGQLEFSELMNVKKIRRLMHKYGLVCLQLPAKGMSVDKLSNLTDRATFSMSESVPQIMEKFNT